MDPVGDFLELVSPEAGLDDDDPRMLGIRRDHLAGEQEEIDDVTGYDSSTVSSRQCELGAIGDLMSAELVRADRINASVPEETSDLGRQVLVEIDLHPAEIKRTSPGNSFSMTSGVSLAFASTWRRISSG